MLWEALLKESFNPRRGSQGFQSTEIAKDKQPSINIRKLNFSVIFALSTQDLY